MKRIRSSKKLLSIDVTLSDATILHDNWDRIAVRVGTKEIGILTRKNGNANWFAESEKGPEDLHAILGEDPSFIVMAKRLLAERFYIPEEPSDFRNE